MDETIDALAEIVDIQPKDRRRFRKILDESKNFESVPIRTRLTDEEVARLIARRFQFPGVEVNARLFRDYPNGSLASHFLGYIGRINDRDLKRIEEREQEANYRGTDHIGKIGLEQSYEAELHGITGFEEVEVDAGGRAVRLLRRTAPVAGNNLVLTVDLELQKVAEEAFGNRRGAMVAIEPGSGRCWRWYRRRVSTRTCSSMASRPRIGRRSTIRPTIRCSTAHSTAPIRRVRPSPFMALAALTTGKRTAQQAISTPAISTSAVIAFATTRSVGTA